MLESKFEAVNGDILIFSGKKSVMSIGKLLVKYHENYNEHSLGTNDTFYPCIGTTLYLTSTCYYFSIRHRKPKINRSALCKNCYYLNKKSNQKYKRTIAVTKRLKPLSSSIFQVPYLTELRTQERKKLYYYKSHNIILVSLLKAKKENMVIQNASVH